MTSVAGLYAVGLAGTPFRFKACRSRSSVISEMLREVVTMMEYPANGVVELASGKPVFEQLAVKELNIDWSAYPPSIGDPA